MVYNDDPAQISALEKQGYDVGYIGERTEAAVYLDAKQENLLRAQGYTIGEVVADEQDCAGPPGRDRQDRRRARRSPPRSPRTGSRRSAKAKGAVNVPGHVVIQRAYTFTNYAGRFLYVEARNDLHTDTTGPAMSFTYTSPNGTSAVVNLSNSSISPDGGDAAIGGNKLSDSDAGAGVRYMYHRGLIALRGADASLAAADSHRARRRRQRQLRHQRRHRVGEQGPPGARHGVPEGLHHEVHGPDRDQHPARRLWSRSTRTS